MFFLYGRSVFQRRGQDAAGRPFLDGACRQRGCSPPCKHR